MSTEDKKRYYWLKLDRNFFKRHDIRIIESRPNGKDYILFYLKLLCESTTHNGELRFSDIVPYDYEMLATVTNTNMDIVRAAMEIFTQLGMIEVLEDQTIYMAEIDKMLGSETHAAKRKRAQRMAIGDNVPLLSPKCRIEKEKEKEKDIDKDSSSRSDIWKQLTTEEIDKLYDIYEEAGNLIQEVFEDVRDKGKSVDNAYSYVIGYAKNVGWKRVRSNEWE